jgi:hypothetical protein
MFKSGIVIAVAILAWTLRKPIARAWREKRADGSMLAILSFGQSSFAQLVSRQRQRMEGAIAARHSGDRWSDAVEREISDEWPGYRRRRR